jgi:pilus assembly protein Flp/PilA
MLPAAISTAALAQTSRGVDVKKLLCRCRRFGRDESAATAFEYCLIATLIGLAIIAGATILGTTINAGYSDIAGSIPAS